MKLSGWVLAAGLTMGGAAHAQLMAKSIKPETTKLCFSLGADANHYFECRDGMKSYARVQAACKYRPPVYIDDATLKAMTAGNSNPLDYLDEVFNTMSTYCTFNDRPNKPAIIATKVKSIAIRLQPLPKPEMIVYDTGSKSPEYTLGVFDFADGVFEIAFYPPLPPGATQKSDSPEHWLYEQLYTFEDDGKPAGAGKALQMGPLSADMGGVAKIDPTTRAALIKKYLTEIPSGSRVHTVCKGGDCRTRTTGY